MDWLTSGDVVLVVSQMEELHDKTEAVTLHDLQVNLYVLHFMYWICEHYSFEGIPSSMFG